MKALYLVLNELKRMDEKVFRLRQELDQVPVDLAAMDLEISKSLAEFQEVKTKHDDLEKSIRKAESDLREKEDFLRKAESKMMEVKTNEEYQAAQRENETHKTEKGQLEEKVLGLLSELEVFKKTVKEADSIHQKKAAELNESKKKLQEEGKSIQRSYEELLEKRKSVLNQLDAPTKSLYEKASQAVKGIPISKIDKGLCCSCNVRIRPQLYNEVLGFKAVHRCPSCNRILVAPVDETEALA
ncbi:MAG: zinc ribbon domain-containing protein [Pseudomonadota bacterium]